MIFSRAWHSSAEYCREVTAAFVNTLDVSIAPSNGNFTRTLDAIGTKFVQGTLVPTHEILLDGTTLVRN